MRRITPLHAYQAPPGRTAKQGPPTQVDAHERVAGQLGLGRGVERREAAKLGIGLGLRGREDVSGVAVVFRG
jgi:hypothetical protein